MNYRQNNKKINALSLSIPYGLHNVVDLLLAGEKHKDVTLQVKHTHSQECKAHMILYLIDTWDTIVAKKMSVFKGRLCKPRRTHRTVRK